MPTLYLRNVPPDLDQIKRSELVAQIKRSRPSVKADVAKLIREERPGKDI
jgi:hypothetical protein